MFTGDGTKFPDSGRVIPAGGRVGSAGEGKVSGSVW